MVNSGVLVNFTEQILAIDQLQRPTPKCLKLDPAPRKLFILMVRHPADQVWFGIGTAISEAFLNTGSGAGARSNEFHFREVQQT